MPGLVEQLQADALDPSVPVSVLLGKVKVCAVRLGLQDALEWVQKELSGYVMVDGDDLPEYRRGHGITEGQDQWGRWVPFHMANGKLAEQIASIYFKESVTSYEDLLKSDSNFFMIPINQELVQSVSEAYGVPILGMRNRIARSSMTHIVAKVRDLALDWSIELSRAGITGEGMSFTADERTRANGSHISIGTFNGTFSTGDASGAGASISQTYSSVTNEVTAIAELIAAVQTKVSEATEREAIVKAAQDIASAPDKGAMLKAYERLLSAAANHMTVIAPFLPALGQLLAG